ncbi:MAG TPA: alpha/beta hydrolase [Streptosporangiaceae bacterium]|nr:alpha/beta hydrolase [Streptosporangiaceae bacterium]
MTSTENVNPSVVLVHGAYADGSSWSEVIKRLLAAGIAAAAVQNPLNSLADDVAHARRVLARQRGPVVLAGHSFAGTVISEAGIHPAVAALVYVAARAPDAGEDYAALARRFPAPPASAGLVYADGFGALTRDAFLNEFANGVEPTAARVLYAVQAQVSDTLFGDRTTVAAWRSRPSWYAVSRQDRTISPELQRFMAERMRASTVEIDAGHLPLITHPDEVTQLIMTAVQAVKLSAAPTA